MLAAAARNSQPVAAAGTRLRRLPSLADSLPHTLNWRYPACSTPSGTRSWNGCTAFTGMTCLMKRSWSMSGLWSVVCARGSLPLSLLLCLSMPLPTSLHPSIHPSIHPSLPPSLPPSHLALALALLRVSSGSSGYNEKMLWWGWGGAQVGEGRGPDEEKQGGGEGHNDMRSAHFQSVSAVLIQSPWCRGTRLTRRNLCKWEWSRNAATVGHARTQFCKHAHAHAHMQECVHAMLAAWPLPKQIRAALTLTAVRACSKQEIPSALAGAAQRRRAQVLPNTPRFPPRPSVRIDVM